MPHLFKMEVPIVCHESWPGMMGDTALRRRRLEWKMHIRVFLGMTRPALAILDELGTANDAQRAGNNPNQD
jgi:hypothetical protein